MARRVSGKLLTWTRSYLINWSIKIVLSGQSIKVVLSGQSSITSSIYASDPQGSILGPLLFSVFLDDFWWWMWKPLYLYVDDCTLFWEITSTDDPKAITTSLNRDLGRMRIRADRWKVTFEPSKCEALTISRKRNPTWLDLLFGNAKLAEKDELTGDSSRHYWQQVLLDKAHLLARRREESRQYTWRQRQGDSL